MAGHYVFGYGSLAAGFDGRPARLLGYRRVWGVAMDNHATIPGYKYYRHRPHHGGGRPRVHVAFLDIVEEEAAATDGVAIPVDGEALEELDERERNYERIDVTGAVRGAPGRIWAYRGSAAGRARLRAARRHGSAVVVHDYLRSVRATFAALGIADDAHPGGLALLDLERVELAPAG